MKKVADRGERREDHAIKRLNFLLRKLGTKFLWQN